MNATHFNGDRAGMIARGTFLFVRGFVFLVEDDDAQAGIRQEQRRARPNDYLSCRMIGANPSPDIETFAVAQLAMPDSHLSGKPGGKAADRLWGERDFGHQRDRLLSAL